MDLAVGYWNINKKSNDEISQFIIDLLTSYNLDILFLSEFDNLDVKSLINDIPVLSYEMIKHSPVCDKVIAIQRKGISFRTKTEDKRFLIVKSDSLNITLVGLHLESNCNDSEHAKLDRIKTINKIMEASKMINCEKTAYIGDYNCMPYSDELLDFDGMHAVLFKGEMKINDGGKIKHYNPMLLELNENTKMYGSHRYTSGNYTLYWYAYDQVIVSKMLIDSIKNIKYLKEINGNSLMSPRESIPIISDHLPLIFEIKEEK